MKHSSNVGRKQGFTLIEILVVLVIASIISSITFGAFKSISEGNQRTSCQSNLSQIYQACRQYAQDFDGRFPYLNEVPPATQAPTPRGGLGLWSLYTFQKDPASTPAGNCDSANVDLPIASGNPLLARPLAGYVKSVRVFHCPTDNNDKTIQYRDPSDACVPKKVNTGVLTFQVGTLTYTNPSYLSYQVRDDIKTDTTDPYTDTYSSFRAPDAALPVRQLVPYAGGATPTVSDRPMRELTVVTWCRWHRKIDSNTLDTKPGRRNYDNVLFSDGSVQNLPAEQNVTEPGGAAGTCKGWERVPRGKADSMKDADDCIPSP
jgi:prepilin-type N-terminal cleavage/methylation domain-containing protein